MDWKSSGVEDLNPIVFLENKNDISEVELAGGFNPSEKYARQVGSFPQVSGENYFRNHHLVKVTPNKTPLQFESISYQRWPDGSWYSFNSPAKMMVFYI